MSLQKNPKEYMNENILPEQKEAFKREFLNYSNDPAGFQNGLYTIQVLNMIKNVVLQNGSFKH